MSDVRNLLVVNLAGLPELVSSGLTVHLLPTR